MNIKKLVTKGRQKLELSKPVKLLRKSSPIKLPVTGTEAQAATFTENKQHIIIADTSIKDFLLEYKINHELCHAKLNEMNIRSIERKLEETEFKNSVEKNKSLTLALIVYEFYAEWMCYEVFGVPEELVYAYNKVLSDLKKVREILQLGLFRFVLEITPFLLYERLGYDIDTHSFFKIVDMCSKELIDWTNSLHDFLSKLPHLPKVIDKGFVDTISEMILKIYKTNPISLS